MDLTEPVGDGDHIRGDGPLQLVMYGDYECPYCVAAQRILRRVETRLGDELQFVFRHFPIPEIHPHARGAAEVVEAAAAQGKFWELHDRLYQAAGRLKDDDLLRFAREVGVDVARAEQELRDGVYAARIERDLETGRASGVDGTPAFFANGVRLSGAFDAGSIVEALRSPGT